jgi:DNA polymerase I-like protein with 3'-5' exonuclease and polymerase domains
MKKKEITPQHLAVRDKLVLPPVKDGVELLKREIELCQPNVIVAFGNAALWALTGKWGIRSWRGSVIACDLPLNLDYQPKVIPLVSPSMILKQWSERPIFIHDLQRVKKESVSRDVTPLNYDFIIQPNFGQASATLATLQRQVERGPMELSVDIETRAGHIDCIGFAWSKTEAICIPLMVNLVKGKVTDSHYWTEAEEALLLYRIYRLLTHPNCRVIGQGFWYDAQYTLRHWHFVPNLWQDTMISQHSCFSTMKKSLDFLSSMYCENHVFWKDENKEANEKLDDKLRWNYNCKDCVATFEVASVLRETVKKLKLESVHEFQQSLFWPVLTTMDKGLRVAADKRGQYAMMLFDEIAKREQYFIDVLGFPLNPKSTVQMQTLFYEDFGMKKIFSRKTGAVSCDDEALRKIAEREPLLLPLIRRITEYRSLSVFLSTFVKAPLDIDGRMRCTFKITGTETYRFASSKNAFGTGANLQNIPKGGEESSDLELPNIRELYIPDPGKTYFDIDLDSADLRIVCWEADIPEMKAMLATGAKVYVEVAKEYYKDPTITKHHKMYGTFKSLCHGTHYLGTAKGLATRLGLSVHEVDKIQKWYYGKFPELKTWQDNLKDQVFKRRMVENVFGYRCYFFDRIEGTIFNQAVAWIPQSTVACLINRGYMNIHNNLKEVDVLLQVHDSLAGQFDTPKTEWAVRRIQEECAVPLPFPGDPLIIPVGIKTSPVSWGECG